MGPHADISPGPGDSDKGTHFPRTYLFYVWRYNLGGWEWSCGTESSTFIQGAVE